MKRFKFFGAATCAAVLASCATGGTPNVVENMLSETTGQDGRACVRVSDIRGYGFLQDNIISINGRGSHYLATVTPNCNDLAADARVRFRGDFGEVCGQAMDQVMVEGESCIINQVFEFDDRDDALDAYHAVLERQEDQG